MNIAAAKLVGVPMALAPDWSPTGSAGMIQELNYAASKYPFFTAAELLAMATSNPAKIARLDDKIGTLQGGLYADFLVIRKRGGSPWDSVVTATPADIRLVVVNGQPVYGGN